MAHGLSAALSAILALLIFAAMQAFRTQLASSQLATVFGGFAGANLFVFLVTAVSNVEMETFGSGFQTKLVPEVVICLLVALFASSLVHRVCVTTCFIFSMILIYYINKLSNTTYSVGGGNVASTATVAAKKKK